MNVPVIVTDANLETVLIALAKIVLATIAIVNILSV